MAVNSTLAWISVAVLAIGAWRTRSLWPTLRARVLLSLVAIAAILYPAWIQLARVDARTYPPAVDHAALITIRAHEDALLSEQYYKMGRYQDAVVAARTGVARDPGRVDVWNDLALACMRLGRWDEANHAAKEAIRLAPGDEVANANLAQLMSRSH